MPGLWARLGAAVAPAVVPADAGPVPAVPAAVAAAVPDVGADVRADVGGTWTEIGVERPAMTVVGDRVFVDMSAARRPDATGTVVDATRILVTFPDAGTFLGVLRRRPSSAGPTAPRGTRSSPGRRSSTWQAAGPSGNRPVARVGRDHGRFRLELSRPRHGLAVGFATGTTTIRATFPGDVRRLGTLEDPGRRGLERRHRVAPHDPAPDPFPVHHLRVSSAAGRPVRASRFETTAVPRRS
jgi:hypothetical protein